MTALIDQLDTTLNQIRRELLAAERRLLVLQHLKCRLEATAMYPALPTEQWEKRGNGRYLVLYFKKNGNGEYEGPEGKRNLYIGKDPQRVAAARCAVENRRRYELTCANIGHLAWWIDARLRALARVEREVEAAPAYRVEELGPVISSANSPAAQ